MEIQNPLDKDVDSPKFEKLLGKILMDILVDHYDKDLYSDNEIIEYVNICSYVCGYIKIIIRNRTWAYRITSSELFPTNI